MSYWVNCLIEAHIQLMVTDQRPNRYNGFSQARRQLEI